MHWLRRFVSAVMVLAWPALVQAQPVVKERVLFHADAAMEEGPAKLSVATPIDAFGQRGTLTVDDRVAEGVVLDFGADVRVTRGFLIGAGYWRVDSTDSHPYTAVAPSPFPGNLPVTVNNVTPRLHHREDVLYLSAGFLRPVTDRFDVTVSAGPAFFTVKQDLPYTVGVVGGSIFTVTVPRAEESEDSAVGFHAALNLNYMFDDRLGAGILIRYTRGSIDLPYATSSMVVGGLQIGAGVRARF